MLNPKCDWCPAPATYVIEARWESFWACSVHDLPMARFVADSDVAILDIRKL